MTSKRVRKDHRCHTLGFEIDDMCDKCQHFEERKRGLHGRKPGGKVVPKCEKPWVISCGITKHTSTVSLLTKQKYINILTKYKYTIVDDTCEKVTHSRIYDYNYREGWTIVQNIGDNYQGIYYRYLIQYSNFLQMVQYDDWHVLLYQESGHSFVRC